MPALKKLTETGFKEIKFHTCASLFLPSGVTSPLTETTRWRWNVPTAALSPRFLKKEKRFKKKNHRISSLRGSCLFPSAANISQSFLFKQPFSNKSKCFIDTTDVNKNRCECVSLHNKTTATEKNMKTSSERSKFKRRICAEWKPRCLFLLNFYYYHYCYYNTSRTTAARGHEDGAPPGLESVELPVKEERAWMWTNMASKAPLTLLVYF